MIQNHVKIAWRNLLRHKSFTLINVMGLALGIGCSLMIFLWIQSERAVDAGYSNAPWLYNVMENQLYDGKIGTGSYTPGILAEELKKQFPEIVYAAGITNWQNTLTLAVDDRINKANGHWAGEDWFKMFSLPLLEGKAETALATPTSIAISRRLAELYFDSPSGAIGKTLRIDDAKDYQVSAVFENLPAWSSRQYDFLLNWEDCLERNEWMKEWGNNGPGTCIQVREDADIANLNAKLKHFLKDYNKEIGPSFAIELFLQPVREAYLYSNFINGQQAGGRIEYVRLFAIVAVFILLIACINFMNLSTARSSKRAREVGVRKVVGAARQGVAAQFLGEALLFAFLALGVALIGVNLLLPVFNELTGKTLQLQLNSGSIWLLLLAITLLTGLLAGSYPALFLSALKPVRVLKGNLKFGQGAKFFRQGLVVFQFVLSMLLIVGAVVVYQQVQYIQSTNLGYDRENLIYVPAEGKIVEQFQTFKEQLLRQPSIQSVSTMQELPTEISSSTGGVTWPGKDPNVNIEFIQTRVGYDFAQTLDLDIEGRDFSKEFGTDTSSYIVNEAAVQRMGYDNPIGQPVTMWGRPGTIVGVLKGFHFQSLHRPIQPLIIRLSENLGYQNVLIRTEPGQTPEALAALEMIWEEMNPQFPFTYSFMDETYQALYKSESIVGTLTNYFALLAIFISCLGLLGLAAFAAEQRTKEIGIRKVLGATLPGIVGMLSKDFLKLVLLAICIASPLAWYFMSRWLENFAYSVDMQWWVFALTGLLALGIAFLTVSFQSIKAALSNPVESLRSE